MKGPAHHDANCESWDGVFDPALIDETNVIVRGDATTIWQRPPLFAGGSARGDAGTDPRT